MKQTPLAQSRVRDLPTTSCCIVGGGPAGTGNGVGALANAWNCHTPLMTQKAFPLTATVETDNEVKITRPDARRVYGTSTAVRVQELQTTGRRDEQLLPEGKDSDTRWRAAGIRGLKNATAVWTYARRVWLQCAFS